MITREANTDGASVEKLATIENKYYIKCFWEVNWETKSNCLLTVTLMIEGTWQALFTWFGSITLSRYRVYSQPYDQEGRGRISSGGGY